MIAQLGDSRVRRRESGIPIPIKCCGKITLMSLRVSVSVAFQIENGKRVIRSLVHLSAHLSKNLKFLAR